jgi:hypothetical protein
LIVFEEKSNIKRESDLAFHRSVPGASLNYPVSPLIVSRFLWQVQQWRH